jgi:hypothetical protein
MANSASAADERVWRGRRVFRRVPLNGSGRGPGFRLILFLRPSETTTLFTALVTVLFEPSLSVTTALKEYSPSVYIL